jgi:hypothetical protein
MKKKLAFPNLIVFGNHKILLLSLNPHNSALDYKYYNYYNHIKAVKTESLKSDRP